MDSSQSVQGKGSLQLSGLDANANYWIQTVSTDQVSLKNLAKGQASYALYVNFFAKGSRNGNAYIELQLAEDENGNNQIRSDEDELYKAKFSVTEDWQQFSIKYDDFELANSAGNGIKEPSKLMKVTLALVSIPAGELVTSNIDFVNFTFNKPFSQK